MVVRDRLKEMQENSKHCDGTEAEMKPLNPKAGGAGASTANFFETAEEIALGVTEIQNNVRELRNCQKRIFTEPSRVEREKHQAKFNDLVDINKSLGQKVQNLIRRETERTAQFEKKAKTSNELTELRLRKTQIGTQSNRYLEVWAEYSALQVEYRERAKEALAKNIKITNSKLSQEEIEEKIDSGDVSVFSSAIIQETAAAKDQLAALENRHAEFLKLEASIKEVHSMFLDMHQLVEMQGDLVGRIEDHVNSAVVDVERGRADLGKAENFKKAATKKKFILGGILLLLVLIILLIILSEFGAFSSSGETVTIVKHEHTYNLPNGTVIVSDTALGTVAP